MENEIVSKELADAIDQPLNMSAKFACLDCLARGKTDDSTSCLEKERDYRDRKGNRKGWHQYDASKMCASCACYWHLSCARNFALGVVR